MLVDKMVQCVKKSVREGEREVLAAEAWEKGFWREEREKATPERLRARVP